MRKRAQEIDLDEVPVVAPVPMDDAAAAQLARRAFGARGSAVRGWDGCAVGKRHAKHARATKPLGTGLTWEQAFDMVLTAAGR